MTPPIVGMGELHAYSSTIGQQPLYTSDISRSGPGRDVVSEYLSMAQNGAFSKPQLSLYAVDGFSKPELSDSLQKHFDTSEGLVGKLMGGGTGTGWSVPETKKPEPSKPGTDTTPYFSAQPSYSN